MLVIGLTGGIASGKTTVSDRFAALGVPVIDTDRIAREVVAPGTEGLHRLVQAFGSGVLLADGQLDRGALRQRVFSDPAERGRLEGILHPLIRETALARLAALDAPYAIVVVPLLLETDFHTLVQRILVVDAEEHLQRRRLQERDGCSAEEAGRILAAQASRRRRRQAANDILCNNDDLDALDRQIRELHRRYLTLAAAADGSVDGHCRTGPN